MSTLPHFLLRSLLPLLNDPRFQFRELDSTMQVELWRRRNWPGELPAELGAVSHAFFFAGMCGSQPLLLVAHPSPTGWLNVDVSMSTSTREVSIEALQRAAFTLGVTATVHPQGVHACVRDRSLLTPSMFPQLVRMLRALAWGTADPTLRTWREVLGSAFRFGEGDSKANRRGRLSWQQRGPWRSAAALLAVATTVTAMLLAWTGTVVASVALPLALLSVPLFWFALRDVVITRVRVARGLPVVEGAIDESFLRWRFGNAIVTIPEEAALSLHPRMSYLVHYDPVTTRVWSIEPDSGGTLRYPSRFRSATDHSRSGRAFGADRR
jgi:hypothetical protein